MRRTSGFSLLELLVVLAVMGILMAVGITQLRPPSVRLFAGSLQAQVVQGKFEAVKRNRPVAVVWNASDGSFSTQLFRDVANPNPPCTGTTTQLEVLNRTRTADYRSVQVSGAFLERAGARGVVWYPSGAPRLCDGAPLPQTETSTTITDGRRTLQLFVGTAGRVRVGQ